MSPLGKIPVIYNTVWQYVGGKTGEKGEKKIFKNSNFHQPQQLLSKKVTQIIPIMVYLEMSESIFLQFVFPPVEFTVLSTHKC